MEVLPRELSTQGTLAPISMAPTSLLSNLVQHFRRIQTVHMGQRWFDIKRYGFSINHKWGKDEVVVLEPCDKRYAIQIPDEVIGAGLQPNPR